MDDEIEDLETGPEDDGKATQTVRAMTVATALRFKAAERAFQDTVSYLRRDKFSNDSVAKGILSCVELYRPLFADLPSLSLAKAQLKISEAIKQPPNEGTKFYNNLNPSASLRLPMRRRVTYVPSKEASVARRNAALIRDAERALLPLAKNQAEQWLQKPLWTIDEFAALSMALVPPMREVGRVPSRSEVAPILAEYRHRLDVVRRAAKLEMTDPVYLRNDQAPVNLINWAKRHRPFSIDGLLVSEQKSKPSQHEIRAFLSIIEAEMENVETPPNFRLRKDPLCQFAQETFSGFSRDDFLDRIWAALDKSIAATSGTVPNKYEEIWKPIKRRMNDAWANWKSNKLSRISQETNSH